MAEQVRIDITAEDKASKKIDQVADKVDDLEHAKPQVTVDADTTDAKRDMADLLEKTDKLSAAPATLLLKSNAAAISADIKGLVADIDRLDANDPTVQIKTDQINTLQGDLDQIDAKVKEINGTPLDIDSGPAVKGIDDVGKSADSSKSVLANMIGNSTQDLGALGGVAGSAGVAIGQMGEYMADAASEGEGLGSVLRSFGKVAAPLAAIAAATQLLSDVMASRAKSAEVEAKATQMLTDAYRKGGDAATNYADSLREAGKVMTTTGAATIAETGAIGKLVAVAGPAGDAISDMGQAFGLFGKSTEDLTALFQRAGLSVDTWSQAVVGGNQAFGDLAQGLTKTSLTAVEQRKILDALTESQLKNGEAKRNAAALEDVYAKSLETSSTHVKDLNDAYAAAAIGSSAFADAQQDGVDTLDRVNRLLADQAAALNDQVDAATDAADAQLDENKALADYAAVLKDAKASTVDQRDAAIALAKAHLTTMEAQARARGETITATAKLDAQNAALLSTAATAKGPARQGILDYIGSLNTIPPEKLTEIQAAINAGDLATAQALLNAASAPRTAAIKADADNAALAQTDRELDAVANKERTARIKVLASTGSNLGAGSIISGGPRAVLPDGGAPVATPYVTNVSVNVPRGTRPDDMVRAADRYARRNGMAHARRR